MMRPLLAFLFFLTCFQSIICQLSATDVSPYNTSPTGALSGELRKWHKITLGFEGPETSETAPVNPFTDYRLDVTFIHKETGTTHVVPGYYAADANAANSGASSGNAWLVHFAADQTGTWTWTASFTTGPKVAQNGGGSSADFFDTKMGTFNVSQTNKKGRDHRGKGRLEYVGEHHLQFAETGEWFLKAGADSPENFLAYEDFDNTPNFKEFRKTWELHKQDYNAGDTTWANGKGTGIIGALNYLADKGMNAFSFLPMNIEGDDQNVFPYISDFQGDDRQRIDVSKTAQWEVVFEHADKIGLNLHFKTQETENDQLLDGGELGDERKLYYRELIARFGHHLALTWNIGEENTNTLEQRQAFAKYFKETDPYKHLVVIHNNFNEHQNIYPELLGYPSYDGVSLQSNPVDIFDHTLEWRTRSAAEGRKWVVANDEQSPARVGVMPDGDDPDHDVIRKDVLWANIMAGGAGVEYYFGYKYDNSDLTCQDFRSRDIMWDQSRHALEFFSNFEVPFWEMENANDKVSDGAWCLAHPDEEVIVVYLKNGGTASIDLSGPSAVVDASSVYTVEWYDPKNGGDRQNGSVRAVTGGVNRSLGSAPTSEADKDWIVLIKMDRVSVASPTPDPTRKPTLAPTITPTDRPIQAPTVPPTAAPSDSPTAEPTFSPTSSPSEAPSDTPETPEPTWAPTKSPSDGPTVSPTLNPTLSPSDTPSETPTREPTLSPTKSPSGAPTSSPTFNPTLSPSDNPSETPTLEPTLSPTKSPSGAPTSSPTFNPTLSPSETPSETAATPEPTLAPFETPETPEPTLSPTKSPSNTPTTSPTFNPTLSFSESPSETEVTAEPSVTPTLSPTKSPSNAPTTSPTFNPTLSFSESPSETEATPEPSVTPTISPSGAPSTSPTSSPTKAPQAVAQSSGETASSTRATEPTLSPSNDPPTALPTFNPTRLPSDFSETPSTLALTQTPSIETIDPTPSPADATPAEAPSPAADGPWIQPVLINCGATESYTDVDGVEWGADAYYNAGATSKTSEVIEGVSDSTLYQTYRWSNLPSVDLIYDIPVPMGEYEVTLYFSENFDGTQKAGGRVFDVSMEDEVVFEDVDIYLESGGAYMALQKTATVYVADETLTIKFMKKVQASKVAGIEIHSTSSSMPSVLASSAPSVAESNAPSAAESSFASATESSFPSAAESSFPSATEPNVPSTTESNVPSATESNVPSATESSFPSMRPTTAATTAEPSGSPTKEATTAEPSASPSMLPSESFEAEGAEQATTGVIGLTLVDTESNDDLFEMVDGVVIVLKSVGNKLSIRADTLGDDVESVVFDMDGLLAVNTESSAPYALNGDDDGDYFRESLLRETGEHTVSATAFSRSGGKGEQIGKTVTVAFTVVKDVDDIIETTEVASTTTTETSTTEAATTATTETSTTKATTTTSTTTTSTSTASLTGVIGFTLIDANAEEDIRMLNLDGDEIDLSLEGHSLTIRADTAELVVGSVVFDFDGSSGVKTENYFPYVLEGDLSGDHYPSNKLLQLGEHTLSATAFSQPDGNGTPLGETLPIELSIIESDPDD